MHLDLVTALAAITNLNASATPPPGEPTSIITLVEGGRGSVNDTPERSPEEQRADHIFTAFYEHNTTLAQNHAATHLENHQDYVDLPDVQLNAILAADEAPVRPPVDEFHLDELDKERESGNRIKNIKSANFSLSEIHICSVPRTVNRSM